MTRHPPGGEALASAPEARQKVAHSVSCGFENSPSQSPGATKQAVPSSFKTFPVAPPGLTGLTHQKGRDRRLDHYRKFPMKRGNVLLAARFWSAVAGHRFGAAATSIPAAPKRRRAGALHGALRAAHPSQPLETSKNGRLLMRRPCRGSRPSMSANPQLTLWAAFCRRSAAEGIPLNPVTQSHESQ